MCYKEAYYYLTVVSRNLILAGSGKKEGLHLGLQSVILTQGKIKQYTEYSRKHALFDVSLEFPYKEYLKHF